MKRSALIYLCRATLFAAAACLGIPAFGDSISYTASYAPTPTGDVVGTATDYLIYQCPNSSSCSSPIEPVPVGMPVSVTGVTTKDSNGVLLNFGRLQDVLGTAPGNPTVTSTFKITVTATDTTLSQSLGSATFYGTVNFALNTLSFSTSSTVLEAGDNYTVPNYYGAGHNQTFIYQDLGAYAFGIENQVTSFKSLPVYAMIGPQNLVTPEPATLATTGLTTCVLLGFAVRRKLQAIRS